MRAESIVDPKEATPDGVWKTTRTRNQSLFAMSPEHLAEAVRAACLKAATEAYEDAGVRGLCEAGRWEAAAGALQSLDLRRLVQELESADRRSPAK